MARVRALVVDDDVEVREMLRCVLDEAGYQTSEAADGEEALSIMRMEQPALVLADATMPKMNGLSLLENARIDGIDSVFLMMTGLATVEAAVLAMRAGAEDYLVKPLNIDAVVAYIAKALQRRALLQKPGFVAPPAHDRAPLEAMLGESFAQRSVNRVIQQVGPTRVTVLVLGESGTGKELIAQALHQSSERRDKPFIKVSCAALSDALLESELFGHEKGAFTGAASRREGRFELANGGTLFLDEIGAISNTTQVKLLRVLQQREFERVGGSQTIHVDVRLIAATNRDLVAAVQAGAFRADLFYRLNVVSLTSPPLRERKEDIPALAAHFASLAAQRHGKMLAAITPEFMQGLLAHSWPGNIRELENSIERATVLSRDGQLSLSHLPDLISSSFAGVPGQTVLRPGGLTLKDIERDAIENALFDAHGSLTKAAHSLAISVRKMQYKVKEYAKRPRGAHRLRLVE